MMNPSGGSSRHNGGQRGGDVEMGRPRRNPEVQRLLEEDLVMAAGDLDNREIYELMYQAGTWLTVTHILTLILVLCIVLYFFIPTFKEACDLQTKIWCLGYIAIRLLQSAMGETSRQFQFHRCGHTAALAVIQTILSLGSLGWYGWGTYLIWYCKPCNHATYVISQCLWWFETIYLVIPCCLFSVVCCCLPLMVTYLVHSDIEVDDSIPAASETDLTRIKIRTFRHAVESVARRYGSDRVVLVQGKRQVLMSKVHALGGLASFVGLGEGFLGQSNPLGTPAVPPAAAPGDAIQVKTECPICMGSLEPNDEVAILPCDLRHIFHKDCAFRWLKTRSQCPLCMKNISQVLAAGDDQTAPPR